MQTSELFLTLVRRLIFSFLLIMLVAAVGRAQESGHVGISTRELTVFTNQASTAHSAFLPDFGFGANYLSYCTTGFIGTIDLEWSPTGNAPFLIIAQATYGSVAPDTACRTGPAALQAGGYYINMRSTVTITSGSISAYYSASAAPISAFSPSLGSNGSSSPIACDQNRATAVANGTTASLIGSTTGTNTTVICGFTITYQGATTSGNNSIVWSTSTACTSVIFGWTADTTSSTPQTILLPGFVQRNPSGSYAATTRQTPCFVNASGVEATMSISFAEVPNL